MIDIEELRKNANAGDAEAMYHLGKAYAFGDGVDMDQEKALYWLNKAAECGHKDAERVLAEVGLRKSKVRLVYSIGGVCVVLVLGLLGVGIWGWCKAEEMKKERIIAQQKIEAEHKAMEEARQRQLAEASRQRRLAEEAEARRETERRAELARLEAERRAELARLEAERKAMEEARQRQLAEAARQRRMAEEAEARREAERRAELARLEAERKAMEEARQRQLAEAARQRKLEEEMRKKRLRQADIMRKERELAAAGYERCVENIWVQGGYVDKRVLGVIQRVWEPGHYEQRTVWKKPGFTSISVEDL